MIATLVRVLPLCLMLLSMTPVHAGLVPVQQWCVTTSAELQSALTAAQTNNMADVIRIETGTYNVPAGGFVFDATVAGGDSFALTLSGGWMNFFGTPCGQQGTENAFLTVLNGNGTDRVLDLTVRDGNDVTIRLLGFLNGSAGGLERGGGLQLGPGSGLVNYYGDVRIERNVFIGNEAHVGSALHVYLRAYDTNARVALVNNVITGNHATSVSAASIRVSGGNDGPSGAGVRITNNTIISNTMDSDSTHSSAGLTAFGTTRNLHIHNNNLWGNDTADLLVTSGGNEGVFHLLNNNILRRTGRAPTSQSGNISVEPEYEPCFLCFSWVPLSSSPLVDGGAHPPLIAPFWYLTSLDSRGQARVYSGRVDIGAYESHDRMFSDRFESN